MTWVTPEQRALKREMESRWRLVLDATHSADRPRAEAAIAGLYRLAALDAPRVIWLPCALSAFISAHLYAAFRYPRLQDQMRFPECAAGSAVRNAVEAQLISAMAILDRHYLPHRLVTRNPCPYRSFPRPNASVNRALQLAMAFSVHNVFSPERLTLVDETVSSNVDALMRRLAGFAEGFTVPGGFRSFLKVDGNKCPIEPVVDVDVRSVVRSAVRAAVHSALGTDLASSPDEHTNVFGTYHYARFPFDMSDCFSDDCAWADWANRTLGIPIDRNFLVLAECCGSCWLLDEVCFASERPCINRSDWPPHSETGPTIAYPSGWGLWHWRGVNVPQYLVEQPELLTAERIEKAQNAEVRRVMIERYGLGRFVVDSGARLVHEDARGRLWRKEASWGERIQMVEVRNSTPEPDGSFKTYFLRVPTDIRKASEAVAWTFGMSARTYRPRVET